MKGSRAFSLCLCAILLFSLVGCNASQAIGGQDGVAPGTEQVVPDDVAALFDIDPDEEDSDEDGLSNYIEIYVTGTSPTATDTDEDGTEDGDEDVDGDGLTNLKELRLGTDLAIPDTDHDGITDYKEQKETETNPCIYDTDEDTLSDGDELVLGLDPLNKKTDGSTPDAERLFSQRLDEGNMDDRLTAEDNAARPSLELTAKGNINSRITITITESDDFGDSRAVIGEPIDICGENIGEGTVSFTLKSDAGSAVEGTDKSYNTHIICQYNEDGSTVYLPTNFNAEDNTVSAAIDSEGTYFVLDVQNLFDEMGLPLPTPSTTDPSGTIADLLTGVGHKVRSASTGTAKAAATSRVLSGAMAQADILFLIDTTASMRDEINNVKENVEYFVDALKAKGIAAGLALIDYEDITVDGYDSTRVHKNGFSNWFYDMDAYKSAITGLELGDGGDIPECVVDALETARLLDMRNSAGKIFILVTDADYKVANRYDIPSMENEIRLLQAAGVTCAVVSPSRYQETYYPLYAETNGIWADIYGDFYTELMALADKIGSDIVGDGYWIYLDGPVPMPVRLDEEPREGSTVDTDGDSIPDIDELGEATPSGSINLDALITLASQGAITGTSYGTVQTYKYKTNPAAADTDYDGIDDLADAKPRSNTFKGKSTRLKDGDVYATASVTFSMDYRYFFENNSVYNKKLSVLSSLFAADVYEGKTGVYVEVTEGASLTGNHAPQDLARLLGMDDVMFQKIGNDNDTTDILVGHRLVNINGVKKEVVLLSVRGTNGTFAEWSSNFDVGADTDTYYDMIGGKPEDWKDPDNHKGFDVTANRVKAYVDNYIKTNADSTAETVIWITGHSRGAAIANILGAKYTDKSFTTFVYTFAAPNTTTKSEEVVGRYTSIFNIVNADDLIPYLPLTAKWGFRKYGQTAPYTISLAQYYEDTAAVGDKAGTFEALVDIPGLLKGDDYNNNGQVASILKTFEKVAENREDLYVHTYANNTKEYMRVNRNKKATAERDVKDLKAAMNETMMQFCEFGVDEGKNILNLTVHRAYCYQTPAYFMQVLATLASESGKGTVEAIASVLENEVAKRYEGARNAFAIIGNDFTGGLNHPHWTESYYLIASNDFKKLG